MSNEYRKSVKRKIKQGIYPRSVFIEAEVPDWIVRMHKKMKAEKKPSEFAKLKKVVNRSLKEWKRRMGVTTLGAHYDEQGKQIKPPRYMVTRSTVEVLCSDA